MVLSNIMLIVLAAGVLPFVQSQSGNTALCTTTSALSVNSLGQSPCEVASRLGGVCSGTTFIIPPLQPTLFYTGPSLNNANNCVCSTVYYSMLSACAACQEKNWLRWSTYKTNCTTVYTGVFAPGIPPGTSVPAYAYDDVTTSDGFNATTAQQESNLPESTASPQATRSVPTSPSSTVASASNAKSSNHAGAIAGGVIGGVVALAVIAGIAFWFIRRRRSSRIAPSQVYAPVMTNTGTGVSTAMPPAKLYNPSDPSTFPASTSTFPTTNATIPSHETQHPFMTPAHTGGSQSHFTAPGPRYTGAPEL